MHLYWENIENHLLKMYWRIMAETNNIYNEIIQYYLDDQSSKLF